MRWTEPRTPFSKELGSLGWETEESDCVRGAGKGNTFFPCPFFISISLRAAFVSQLLLVDGMSSSITEPARRRSL